MIGFTSEQIAAWYGGLFWPLVRVLALISVAPLLSHRAIPARIKLGLGVAIAMVLAPNLPSPPITDVMTGAGLALLAQNILIGVIIGFAVRLIFAALELTGEMIGLQMGLSFAGFFNPASGMAQNAVGSFMSLLALLTTLVLLFGFQGEAIIAHPLVIALIAVPILIQVYFNAGLAYWLSRRLGVAWRVAAPAALIGASNFFELAVAAAISLFGLNSGAALATVEVPVMLSVVSIVKRTRPWYEARATA